MAVNCNNGTLNVYVPDQNNPWNISKVLFVFRRLGFSVKFKEVKNYLNSNPNDLIDELFDQALNMPVSPDPGWANFNNADFSSSGKNRGAFFRDHQKIVFEDLNKLLTPLREKHAELSSKEDYLEEILQSNAKKVRAFTKPLLEEVKSSIGISKY